MIDLFDIRAFTHIADLGSISASARVLDAPKSSISRSLTRLEKELGVVLVERTTRHLRLTDAGRLYRNHAERILNEVEEAEATLGRFTSVPRGTLRVNAPYAFTLGAMMPMLPGFLHRYPEVDVVFEAENSGTHEHAGEADIMVRLGQLPDSGLIARRIVTIDLWTCASPAYLQAHGAPSCVGDLARHDLIGLSDRRSLWSFKTADGRTEEVQLHCRAVVPDAVLARVALAGGAGIGRLPDFMAAEAIAKGELVRVLPQMWSDTTDVHVLYPSHRSLSAKVRVFVDELLAWTALQRAVFVGGDQSR